MKRKRIVLAVVILGLFLLGLWSWRLGSSNSPQFVPVPPNFKVGSYSRMFYEFLIPSPFEGGLVWITVSDKNPGKHHVYLYDIEQKKVLGELINGWPIFGNRDQSKVVLSTAPHPLKQQLFELLDKITGGKLNLARANRAEGFAVFDRTRNESKAVGLVYQIQGTGSRWYPSPDYRYGYTQPTANSRNEIFLCDLEKPTVSKITVHGTPAGWWNATSILLKSEDNDLSLYDVVKDQTSILLPNDEIKKFLKENALDIGLASQNVKPFPMWDGQQYQFYYSDNQKRWQATNAPLAKIERPSGKLQLIGADFKFEWSDSFDSSGRYYAYSGRDFAAGEKVSAVYLRDLKTGTTRTLVEDCGVNQHSIPRIYGDSVIYSRSNKLWRIGFNETNAARIFPPAGE